jgi:hypothetical protein
VDYVKLSTAFYLKHAKLSLSALGIYAAATALAGQLESDGILDEAQLATLPGGRGRDVAIKELVEAGVLVQQNGNGTFELADYKQVSHAKLEERRRQARGAAEARWGSQR